MASDTDPVSSCALIYRREALYRKALAHALASSDRGIGIGGSSSSSSSTTTTTTVLDICDGGRLAHMMTRAQIAGRRAVVSLEVRR